MKKKTKKKAASKKKSPLKKKKKVYRHWNCHDCLAPIDEGQDHVCIPVTEKQLFSQLNEDLQDAYEKLKTKAQSFGEQKIYNNARAVMFARRVCYMFVRPKKAFLELTFFLPREEDHSIIHRVQAVSKSKFSHMVRIKHRDEIEGDLLVWLKEAFDYSL